jgi:hypothetical protein
MDIQAVDAAAKTLKGKPLGELKELAAKLEAEFAKLKKIPGEREQADALWAWQEPLNLLHAVRGILDEKAATTAVGHLHAHDQKGTKHES